MTPEERETRVLWLSKQIQIEEDSKNFDQYVLELNDLLEFITGAPSRTAKK